MHIQASTTSKRCTFQSVIKLIARRVPFLIRSKKHQRRYNDERRGATKPARRCPITPVMVLANHWDQNGFQVGLGVNLR